MTFFRRPAHPEGVETHNAHSKGCHDRSDLTVNQGIVAQNLDPAGPASFGELKDKVNLLPLDVVRDGLHVNEAQVDGNRDHRRTAVLDDLPQAKRRNGGGPSQAREAVLVPHLLHGVEVGGKRSTVVGAYSEDSPQQRLDNSGVERDAGLLSSMVSLSVCGGCPARRSGT